MNGVDKKCIDHTFTKKRETHQIRVWIEKRKTGNKRDGRREGRMEETRDQVKVEVFLL